MHDLRWFGIRPSLSSETELWADAPLRALSTTDSPQLDAVVARDPELSKSEWAVFLLHAAAEIEHALLVQYLYAAYSLKSGEPVPGQSVNTSRWRRVLVGLALEEMGHLLTLQNLLWLVGGPPNFERQDFPFRSGLYPFEFRLERFTRDSLAKYVVAEMPEHVSPEVMSEAEQREVRARAGAASGGTVNHVGVLYAELVRVFSDPNELPDQVFRSGRADWQERADQWGASDDTSTLTGIRVLTARDRGSAVDALRYIALQGEAPDPSDPEESHFERLLTIDRQFPEDFVAAHKVATNPTTSERTGEGTVIRDEKSRLWAKLLNVRYRELLALLAHSVDRPASDPRSDVLRGRTFEVMSDVGSVRSISKKLVTLDIGDGSGRFAGPPFEMPYTLALSPAENDRWRLYLELLQAEGELAALIADSGLDAMVRANARWREQINSAGWAD